MRSWPPKSDLLFENFVVGRCNEMAYAAALDVAKNPGRKWNPLYIFGGTGVGKTHLLHAIGNYVYQDYPMMAQRLVIIQAYNFIAEYVDYIKDRKAEEFRGRYMEWCDVLLIDDIHFLAGKESTQEMFFQIFNYLFETGRQIVITSDQLPSDMQGFQERLRSRLSMGLVVEMFPPDFETRIAVLKILADREHQTKLPDDVAMLIAEKVVTNARDLRGALSWIVMRSQYEGRRIDREFVKEVLNIKYGNAQQMTFEKVLETTAKYYSLRPPELLSPRRPKHLAEARQIAMYLCKELINMPLKEIGRRFGGRDHSTVIHACKKVEESIVTNLEVRSAVESIRNELIGRKG